jgi:hypothetical protein
MHHHFDILTTRLFACNQFQASDVKSAIHFRPMRNHSYDCYALSCMLNLIAVLSAHGKVLRAWPGRLVLSHLIPVVVAKGKFDQQGSEQQRLQERN